MIPLLLAMVPLPSNPIVSLTGLDFSGGGSARYFSHYRGERVNFVYALPTGLSKIEARFRLEKAPMSGLSLHVRALDDETPVPCPIRIALNDTTLFEGSSPFSATYWGVRRYPLPPGALRSGENVLRVENRSVEGEAGMPPWFMVARAAIAEDAFRFPGVDLPALEVTVPAVRRPFPEPLAKGERPGFAIRGIKGWMWPPEAYAEVIPTLRAAKMNFLMNCYTSMCDIEHFKWGDPRANRWWEPLPAAKRRKYEAVVRACQRAGIAFCFSMNPSLCTARSLAYDSRKDLEDLYRQYAWMQSLGVRWFSLAFDDIGEGIDAAGQARVANEVFRRLRAKDRSVRFVLCPTAYWGDGKGAWQRPYLETLAADLDPAIWVFWTGEEVYGPISTAFARSFRAIVRHPLFVWDNYPVNDDNPTMHLGPVVGRDRDLGTIADGYLANSMCRPREANRIPILTCADYAYNPRAYDPDRSVGQALLRVARSSSERRALASLVELYPGFLRYGDGSAFNPVRARLSTASPAERAALRELLKTVTTVLRAAGSKRYVEERRILEADRAWIRAPS
ncbi:MAG: beta-N-acetylglucosaminidase domain-containing protein [Fimbriimonadaceae bacterium]|nr:beta-N-acetylglucosaminidase domain-containing protein [Fimbriimonadaceae bacterium]